MDIYFDFEATQYSEKIISIGATCERGDFGCFISNFAKKITPYITELTGITKEMVTGAPTADEAFTDLYTWINELEPSGQVVYHSYGNADKIFLLKTAKDIKNKNIADFVRTIANTILDDTLIVNHYFQTSSIGIYNALKKFEPELPEQTHDAVDDAIMLFKLMEYIKEAAPDIINNHNSIMEQIKEHQKEKNKERKKKTKKKVAERHYKIVLTHRFEKSAKIKIFKDIATATNWMFQRVWRTSPTVKIETVMKNVNKALNNHTPYGNWYWEKVYEE